MEKIYKISAKIKVKYPPYKLLIKKIKKNWISKKIDKIYFNILIKPKHSYIICATERTGTNFLCELLTSTKIAGNPREYFLKKYDYKKKSRIVIKEGTTKNKVFGIKIMSHQFFNSFINQKDNFKEKSHNCDLRIKQSPEKTLYNPKYIFLKRKDALRQAVSYLKAKQTNIWRETIIKKNGWKSKLDQKEKFNFNEINQIMNRTKYENNFWEKYFKKRKINYLTIYYEDLIENPKNTLLKTLKFLEIKHKNNLEIPKSNLKKQSNEINEEWVKKYNKIKNKNYLFNFL